MKAIPALVLLLAAITSFGQNTTRMVIVGDVKDGDTGEPLAYATVGVKGRVDQTVSDAEGKFELKAVASAFMDTLIVTYVGYEKFEKAIQKLASFEHILLKQHTTVLEEVRVVHRQLDLRDIDRSVKPIRDNLYAMPSEVTNIQYNAFLGYLEDYNKLELKKKYDFDLSRYEKSVKEFYQVYHKPSSHTKRRDPQNFNDHPVINISHESAVEYCKWLTDQYNNSPKKKKYKKVLFRLPTLKEWQIAALGESKFQSWDLHENIVEVIMSDSNHVLEGPKKKMKYDDTMMYPWFRAFPLRNRVYNQFGCYLGNFRITTDRNCPSRALAYDGFTMTAYVEAYFPNDIGLYDVVGNVAEMIDEKGRACGGSWNDLPEESTIYSIKSYRGPDETVGFRLFMEVIEK